MKKKILIAIGLCVGSMGAIMGQTTLTGDHVITGDLNVGNTGTKGNLEVNGETGNSAAPGIKVTGDGGVVFEGTSGTGQIPAIGDGVRMMWYPKKAAFRAGNFYSWMVGDGDIGINSTAFGNARASGYASFAAGEDSYAVGMGDVAIGTGVNAYGLGATAFGEGSSAGGIGAFSAGSLAGSNGWGAVALGAYAWSNGHSAIAMGESAAAYADYAVAIGKFADASGAYGIVLGHFNQLREGLSDDEWIESEPLLIVGNGNGVYAHPQQRSDAFIIYKNGNVEIPKRQGDILMGEFGNPE